MTDTIDPAFTTQPIDTTPDLLPPSVNKWPAERRVYLAGSIMYAIEGILVMSFFALYIVRKRGNAIKLSIKTTFFLFSFLHALVAFIWSVLKVQDASSSSTFTTGRLSLLFFFSAFCTIVLFWASNYNKQLTADKKTKAVFGFVKIGFVLFNIVVYLFVIILMIVWLAYNTRAKGHAPKEGYWPYEANVWGIIFSTLVIALGFLVYGVLFLCTTYRVLRNQPTFMAMMLRISGVTVLYTACFTVQCVMWMYRPITKKYLNIVAFVLFAYIIPGTVPVVVQLILMREKENSNTTKQTKSLKDRISNEASYHELEGK